MTRVFRHLIVAVLVLTMHGVAAAQSVQPPAPPLTAPVVFDISVRGVAVGQETVTVTPANGGFVISSSGGQTAPAPLTIDKFVATYARGWQPVSLEIEARAGGQLLSMKSTFTTSTASSDVMQGGQKVQLTHPISPGAIILPNNFFGAYEALAGRLATLGVGGQVHVYVAPQAEIIGTINTITPQRIQTPDRLIELRHYSIGMQNPSGVVDIEVAVDGRDRLARVAVPAAGILVLRSDLSGVMKRDVTYTNDNDEQVFINSLGFTLAGTVTAPKPAAGTSGQPEKMPAVVLIAGAGSSDRDETVGNVPLFGQLAGSLSAAGYFVVRYDKRGVGQSGGRAESATLQDYADDAVKVVEWLDKRKDIDDKRIVLVGHSEGGYIAMQAARRAGGKVAAVVLLSSPGTTGRELVIAQQQHALDLANDSPDVRAAKVRLQEQILTAVATGSGWDGIPPAVQKQADTLWFKSLIEFDPADVMKKLKQPVLIVHGAKDMVIAASNASQLDALASGRKEKAAPLTKTVILPGLNHLLVPATTGEVEEYASLTDHTVSPEVARSITDWLSSVLNKRQ